MSRYVAGGTAGSGSATLPIFSIYSAAGVAASVVEIGVSIDLNTLTDHRLTFLTSVGTRGAAVTPTKFDPDAAAASCTVSKAHTVAPTLGTDLGYAMAMAATAGRGYVWRFPGGIDIPVGTTNGIGVIRPSGTGSTAQFWIVWDEAEE